MKRGVAERGDILLVELNPTAGREQQGRRPVAVLTPLEFNRLAGVALVCPISQGAGSARPHGFAVPLAGTGTQTQGVILCHQSRTLDLAARRARFLEAAPDYLIADVLARVRALLDR